MIYNRKSRGNVHFVAGVVQRDSGICRTTLRTSIWKDQWLL